jgi:alcohol dehydrogenase (cytochrome c)
MGRRIVGAVIFVLGLGVAIQGVQQPAPPLPPVVAPVPPVLQNYRPLSSERLTNPEDGDWSMIRRTYNGWGYSPLDQISAGNVTRLRPAWVFATGANNGHEAPPIVNSGVMFVATPGNQVIALDAVSGAVLWR